MKESFSQVLVHVDDSPQALQRIGAARRLAQVQGAAVTALFGMTPALLVVPFAPEAGAAVVQSLREIDDERRARARTALEGALATPGPAVEWAQVQGYPVAPIFAQQALYADLLVLGQHDPDAVSAGVPPDFAESVIAASGKPALVMPYQGARATLGQSIVIAWKPTRESAHAVAAAVPMLQRARRVDVIAWGDDEEAVDGARLDLPSYLKLRGIEASWHRERGEEPDFLGELILSRACDLDADMLVMGCYGHSRAREWVLGGTSRTVLRSMTMPVLMAH
jgi:nucleotide-binding universal stress UspA family protein